MSEKNPFFGATFAERKALREGVSKVEARQVDSDSESVEDKSVTPKRTTRKKG